MLMSSIFTDKKDVNLLNPERVYYLEGGYKLSHFKVWRLSYGEREIMTESHVNFWNIVDLFPRKTYKFTDVANFAVAEWQEKQYVGSDTEGHTLDRIIRSM